MGDSSVKVAVRVRPFNAREKGLNATCCIKMNGAKTTIVSDEGEERDFSFDYSFWSHDGYIEEPNGYLKRNPSHSGTKYDDQEKVYSLLGLEVLENAWNGYHCCLFAYGQTGAGKSYSMIGYGTNKGIVPQATAEIFERISKNNDDSKSYEVQAYMVEIYNERVQDLLIDPKKRPGQGLKVRESKLTGVYVEGVTKRAVSSYAEIEEVMETGNTHRSIGAHAMNQTSSRAHTIIAIEFKQILEAGKVKTEKFSVINLVDLAGSEKSSQTGATGDRLKEGCAINKSLTTLGIVIKVLAEKSSGKKSSEVVPYRNSQLTRMLQNALGGNSKTLMICALSPASSNYEETLSTLRYADRAKSIKNKAIVNESETEKLIRELKEENERLKKMVEGGGSPGGMDSDEYKLMLEENQRQMEEREKTWEQKLKEAQDSAGVPKAKELDVPHIANLSDDEMLDKMSRYDVSSGKTYVGRKNGDPVPQIKLGGSGIQKNHAYFEASGDDIILKSNDKSANDQIKVNGKAIGKGVKLHHNDRIVFGASSVFIYLVPGEPEDTNIDYETALEEVNQELLAQKEQQMAQQKEEDEQRMKEAEAKQAEELAKKEAEIAAYEQKMKELEAKMKLEKEEGAKKEDLAEKKRIEDEIRRKELEMKEAELKAKQDLEEQKEMLERKRKQTERLNETLDTLLPLVKEGNISANELKRKYEFEPMIVSETDERPGLSPLEEFKNRRSVVKVKVTNKEDGYHYFWDPEKFSNRLFMIREVMDDYFETGKIPKVEKENDPFWDPQEAILIGKAYIYLASLGYMLDNPLKSRIYNANTMGENGTLDVNIIPTDETGKADECPEELMVDEPEQLIGKRIDFNIVINKAENLPEMLSKNVYVTYQWYLENDEFRTEHSDAVDPNPVFNYKHHMTIDYVTEDLLKYFKHDALTFKVYGTPTNEKFRKQLVKEDTKKKIINVKPTPGTTTTVKTEKKDGDVEVVKKSGCCSIF